MRILNILVIAALVVAASYVYKIKFDSTLQAERVAKLRHELRRERDTVASLRAEWARLQAPTRIQGLAERHLKLKPMVSNQFDNLDNLPPRPPALPPQSDPIASVIAPGAPQDTTGSIGTPGALR
jgi:cell division protein FtsL